MPTYQSQQKRHWRRDQGSNVQRVLLIFISLCVLTITALVLVVAQEYLGHTPNGQHPTPTPAVSFSPTPPISSPTPMPTQPPTPTPTGAPTPTPTPLPSPPGVLGYPLYGGNPHLPEIALTFDDGPNPSYTHQILALLRQYHVRATFFVIGSEAAAYPSLVQQEYQQGNVVGNHSWTHPNLTTLSPAAVRNELQSTSGEIEADTGTLPTVFRPPGGNFNSPVQSIAASLGLSTILWNVDPRDWSRPGTGVIIQRVLESVRSGSIVIMHDGGGDRSQTVAALPTIITTLEQRGYQFVTIAHMIQELTSQGTGPSLLAPGQLSPEGFFSPGLTFVDPFIRRISKKVGKR